MLCRTYKDSQLFVFNEPEVAFPENSTSDSAAPSNATSRAHSLPQLWVALAERHGDAVALVDPHHSPRSQYTYSRLATDVRAFGAGLASLGLRPGERLALFAENSSRWLVADQGTMAAGAVDAVRGASAPPAELAYILRHSGASALVVQDAAALDRLLSLLAPAPGLAEPQQPPLRFVATLWGEPSAAARAALPLLPMLSYEQVLGLGHPLEGEFEMPPVQESDLATLVYTSGTSGQPKGVELTHGNLLYQVKNLGYYISVRPGDSALSLLPPWHIYERSCTYFLLSQGARVTYTSTRHFQEDLRRHPPDYFVCVPLVLGTLQAKVLSTLRQAAAPQRVLASLLLAAATAYVRARRLARGLDLTYARTPAPALAQQLAWVRLALLAPLYWLAQRLVLARVRGALGVRRAVISGGGSLSPALDLFFETIGLEVLNGYGLTETSPVLACRRAAPGVNVRGSVGLPVPGTQLRAVNPATGAPLPPGMQGLLLARGPGVMQGYLGDPGATAKVCTAHTAASGPSVPPAGCAGRQ